MCIDYCVHDGILRCGGLRCWLVLSHLIKYVPIPLWDFQRVVPRMIGRDGDELNNTPLVWDDECSLLNYHLGGSWLVSFFYFFLDNFNSTPLICAIECLNYFMRGSWLLCFPCFSSYFTEITRIPFLYRNLVRIFNFLKTLLRLFYFAMHLNKGYKW